MRYQRSIYILLVAVTLLIVGVDIFFATYYFSTNHMLLQMNI